MTQKSAMQQVRSLLEFCTDDKLLALTPEKLVSSHKIKIKEATAVLYAAQETRRRQIAARSQPA